MSKTQGRDQLVSEARIALPILGVLLLVFVIAGYRRFSGWAESPPATIRSQELGPEDKRDQPTRLPGAEIRRPENPDNSAIIAPARPTDSTNPARSELSPARLSQPRPQQPSPTTLGNPLIPPAGVGRPRPNGDAPSTSLVTPSRDIRNSGSQGLRAPDPARIPVEQRAPNLTPGRSPNMRVDQHRDAPRTGIQTPPRESNEAVANPADSPKIDGVRLTILAEDSYWNMSERSYGTGQYFRALHAYLSAASSAPSLRAGDTFVLPELGELRQRYPELCPPDDETASDGIHHDSVERPSSYLTNGGETLFQLAADHLGQASRYMEIVSLNRSRLGAHTGPNDALPANLRLSLPTVIR